MAYDLGRAALALLCVLVVLFAGSLLPATGFGTYPTRSANGGTGASAPASGVQTPASSASATTVSSGTVTAAASTETANAQTTARQTTATTAAAGTGGSNHPPSFDLTGLLLTLFGTLAVGVVAVLIAAILRGTGNTLGARLIDGLPWIGDVPIAALVGSVPRRTLAFVVGLSASVPGVLDTFATVVGDVGRGLGTALTGLGKGTVATAGALVGVTGELLVGFPRAVGSLGTLFSGLSGVGSALRRSRPRFGRMRDTGRAVPVSADAESEPEPIPQTVEEAWKAMIERVPMRNPRTATPGEYARAAVRFGLPSAPVRHLTRVFEEVRYGARSDSPSRLQIARQALASIRSDEGGDDS